MQALTDTQRAGLSWVRENRLPFIARLQIETKKGQLERLDRPAPAQRTLVQTLGLPGIQELVCYKPRQVYFSTGTAAHVFHAGFGADHPLRTLVATNHNDTTRSLFGKHGVFYETLPGKLKRLNPWRVNHTLHSLVSDATAARIDHLTAGGKGQGRGWTYQRLVAEELAFWPHAAEAWAAIQPAIDDDAQTIIISTPNGPGDFYHSRVLTALEAVEKQRPGVAFLFSRWSDHPGYAKAPAPGWEPSHEEWELGRKHGLSLAQLYWRHDRIHGIKGIGDKRFRREYPLTIEDGFIVVDGSWYDSDYLNDVLNSLPVGGGALSHEGGCRIYRAPEPGIAYAAGVDPSWCNGGDDAVCEILDEDGNQAAVLSSNEGGEQLFAAESAELIAAYDARVLTESNPGGAGRNVLRFYEKVGLRLWTDDKDHDWTTHHGNKEEAFGHDRQLVNGDAYTLRDPTTIQQLLHIREVKGRIGGQDGYKDDHAVAHVLAGWNLRTLPRGTRLRPRATRRSYARPLPQGAIHSALSGAAS